MKHANKHAKAYMKRHDIKHIDVAWNVEEPVQSEEARMRAAYERAHPPSYLRVWHKPGDDELLEKRAYNNRHKRLQIRAESMTPRPNRRTRRRITRERLLADEMQV